MTTCNPPIQHYGDIYLATALDKSGRAALVLAAYPASGEASMRQRFVQGVTNPMAVGQAVLWALDLLGPGKRADIWTNLQLARVSRDNPRRYPPAPDAEPGCFAALMWEASRRVAITGSVVEWLPDAMQNPRFVSARTAAIAAIESPPKGTHP